MGLRVGHDCISIIKSEYEWENVYAHKPWVVVQNGIVDHFYCAVNDKGERFIALATSQPVATDYKTH